MILLHMEKNDINTQTSTIRSDCTQDTSDTPPNGGLLVLYESSLVSHVALEGNNVWEMREYHNEDALGVSVTYG